MGYDEFKSITQVVPEAETLYWRRIKILQVILRFGPIGRKSLADKVGLTERPLRTETDRLKQGNLIESTGSGMIITEQGERAIAHAIDLEREHSPIQDQEKTLARYLGLTDSRIVVGDYDKVTNVISEMGIHLARYLDEHLPKGEVRLAVTGGTTMMQVAKHLPTDVLKKDRSFTVVSGRGGMGESLSSQANTISSELARKLDGSSYSLFAPDTVTEETYDILVREPSVQKTLNQLQHLDAVLFSVGEAGVMAKRRGFSTATQEEILSRGAVGEAFGSYFNRQGQIVYQMPRVGLQLNQLGDVPLPILVVGGHLKAEAVSAFSRLAPTQLVLITDEGLAHQVLNGEPH